MSCYVLAVGGTGNKILESVVYAATIDGFYTLGENGQHAPIPELRLMSVDVDTACGNTTRARRAAEHYEALRRAYLAYPGQHIGFHTAVRARRWNMNLSRRAMSVNRMVENHRRDQLLSRAIFSKTEAALEYSEGFRGHPDLGVLFFADLLKSLDRLRAEGQPDEMNDLTDEIQAEINRGETVKLILCGSIFGGTGASGIPAIARYLRERFSGQSRHLELAAMLMLPYYKVPPASRNEELEIVVKSSAFLDKARTALQYYGMEGLIKDGEADENGLFDALYMLGLPPESFVTTRIYSTGSQSQENDAHMMEWLATRCIATFFRTGFRGADAHHIDCYYYQSHTPNFEWRSFDAEETLYREGYGRLIKAAALFFSECYPTMLPFVTGERSKSGKVGYCAPYFRGVKRMSGTQRARLEKLVETLYMFLSFYVNWMVQVIGTLPPTLREPRDSEQVLELARDNYDRLTQRRALLEQRDAALDETQAQREEGLALREAYEEMQMTRAALMPKIGGQAWLELLKGAQDAARASLYRQEQAVGEMRERIDRWHGEDSGLIEPQALRQEEERLGAMERECAYRALRYQQIGADVQAAIRENVVEQYPDPDNGDGDMLPQNGLMDAALLEQLHLLLIQYGLGEKHRDRAAFDHACVALQKELHRLVKQPVPDRMTTARVIAGLGGGTRRGEGAEGAICSFLTVLMNAVGEGDMA